MDARKELAKAKQSYWIARRDLDRTRKQLVDAQRARSQPKRRKNGSDLPGPWFDITVIALTLALGITCIVQGYV